MKSTFSLELNLSLNGDQVTGFVTYRAMKVVFSKSIYEDEANLEAHNLDAHTLEAVRLGHALQDNQGQSKLSLVGTFDVEKGLLCVEDETVIEDSLGFTMLEQGGEGGTGWEKDKYRLMVSPDGESLTGVLKGTNGLYNIAFRANAF